MYGVPADLPLNRFVNATLIQVSLGQYEIQLHFTPEGYIGIEGKWELKDSQDNVIDEKIEYKNRESWRIHKIIGQNVQKYEINTPISFTLHFMNGYSLIIYDDSKEYESFSIQPGDIFI
jgi:hypothetical protein